MSDLVEQAQQPNAAIQIIRYDGSTVSIRTWVLADVEEVERLAAELGEPGGEYLAPAEVDGFGKRAVII